MGDTLGSGVKRVEGASAGTWGNQSTPQCHPLRPLPSHRASWDSERAWLNTIRKASASRGVAELSLEMTQEMGRPQKAKSKPAMHQGQSWDLGRLSGVILEKHRARQSFLCKQGNGSLHVGAWLCAAVGFVLTTRGIEAFFMTYKSLCNLSCQHLGLSQSAAHIFPQYPYARTYHGMMACKWCTAVQPLPWPG